MAKRALHPALKAHGAKVARAHAMLSRTPEFKALKPTHRMRAVQAHIKAGKC